MITYFSGKSTKYYDYIFQELSSYIGMPFENYEKAKNPDVVFICGTTTKKIDCPVKIFIDDIPNKWYFNYDTDITSYFSWKEFKIPVFNGTNEETPGEDFITDNKGDPVITIKNSSGKIEVHINFEILKTLVYFLGSLEEMESRERDEFGRFRHTGSVIFRESLLHTPFITAYMDVLLEVLKEAYKKMDKPFVRVHPWPEGKTFALGLSHDADEIRRWTMKKGVHNMIKLKPGESVKTCIKSTTPLEKDDYWTFTQIMSLEDKLDVRSSFYVSGLTNKIKNSRPYAERKYYELAYTTDDKEIQKMYQHIEHRGWELGLHSSFSANNDPARLKEERDNISSILGNDIPGLRQHFLRFTVPFYFHALEKAGFEYDSSIGYSTTTGYRNGTCYPYTPFDLKKVRGFNLLEIPVTIMDGIVNKNNKVKPKSVAKDVMEIISKMAPLNGGCSLIWHTNRFVEDEFPGWGKAYEIIIKESLKLNGYLTTLKDINTWWNTRENVTLKISQKGAEISTKGTIKGLTLEFDGSTEQLSSIKKNKGIEVIKRDGKNYLIIDEIKNKTTITW